MKPGDRIYVPSAFYIDHGEDDVVGGWAIVESVEERHNTTFVAVIQHPGRGLNMAYLAANQAAWAKEYGDQEARPDPDCHPRPNPTPEELAGQLSARYLAEVVQCSRNNKPYKHLLPGLKYWSDKSEKGKAMIADLVKTLGG